MIESIPLIKELEQPTIARICQLYPCVDKAVIRKNVGRAFASGLGFIQVESHKK
jgi:hypothetical protein